MTDNNDDGYKVGYGRPPKHTQFKKGQSGFAGRRKRDVRTYNQIMADALMAPLVVHENGRKKKITAMEGLAKKSIHALLTSDKPREIAKFMQSLSPEVLNAMQIKEHKEQTAGQIVEMLAGYARDRNRFKALQDEFGADPYILIKAMADKLGIEANYIPSRSYELVEAYVKKFKS